ncbi:VanZ family protein [Micromonospora sp. MP36]|uniref:VanZ family protein n=1 Tax=unclassified Micromonospora TaxID=2617518 RepID=UPI0011D93A99|nr:VanZ family protein [Micromonospora sp. MP36]
MAGSTTHGTTSTGRSGLSTSSEGRRCSSPWDGCCAWCCRRGRAVAAAAGLSLLIELGQLLLCRVADVDDVMLNSCGCALGVGIAAGLTRLRARAS